MESKVFELNQGKVEERKVSNPSNEVEVDPLEPLLHKNAYLFSIEVNSGASRAAAVDILLENYNRNVNAQEDPHQQKYECVHLEECFWFC